MVPTKKTTAKETPAEAKKAAPKKAAAPRPAVRKAAPKKAAAPKKEAVVAAVEVKPTVAAEAPAVVEAAVVVKPAALKGDKGYIYALGRRKTAIAQVRMVPNGKGDILVNGKKFNEYFVTFEMRDVVMNALKAVGLDGKVDITIQTRGGGLSGQAVAVRLGISRALIKLNETYRATLKKMGFLMRDPREKERKKYGLKKARKGPQWAKR
jgi:small subunit ribosomal protein S9